MSLKGSVSEGYAFDQGVEPRFRGVARFWVWWLSFQRSPLATPKHSMSTFGRQRMADNMNADRQHHYQGHKLHANHPTYVMLQAHAKLVPL